MSWISALVFDSASWAKLLLTTCLQFVRSRLRSGRLKGADRFPVEVVELQHAQMPGFSGQLKTPLSQ